MNPKLWSACLLAALCTAASGADCFIAIYGGGTGDTFSATFSGDQEVPPIVSNGTGTGTFRLNADETELSYDVSVSGMSGPATGAHFHNSPDGAAGSGPIVFSITDTVVNGAPGADTANGSWPLSAVDLMNLRLNYIYVNFHTEQNPSGEIRGNVVPAQ